MTRKLNPGDRVLYRTKQRTLRGQVLRPRHGHGQNVLAVCALRINGQFSRRVVECRYLMVLKDKP